MAFFVVINHVINNLAIIAGISRHYNCYVQHEHNELVNSINWLNP